MNPVIQNDTVLSVRALFLALVSWASASVWAHAEGPSGAGPANYDCGTLALYTLLRLEGRATRLVDVGTSLHPRPAPGSSMRELRDAAASLGVRLTGIRLPPDGRLDRPAIVFTRRGGHGHFFVLRPVGHTGELVQVLDALQDPDVTDMPNLVNSPGWTGLALIPSRPRWPVRLGWSLLGIAIICSLGLLFAARRSRRRAGLAGSGTEAETASIPPSRESGHFFAVSTGPAGACRSSDP